MASETQRFTPDQIERFTINREWSDSELKAGGATEENGILSPTQEQIDEIAAERHRLGVLALRDPLHEDADISIDSLVQERMARADLKDKIDSVLEPYAALFSDKVPPVSSNKRGLRGKVKIKGRDVPAWEYDKTFDNVPVHYQFDLRYISGEANNDIERVDIELTSPELGRYENYRLSLGYEENKISKIGLGRKKLGRDSRGIDSDRKNFHGLNTGREIFEKTLHGSAVGNFAETMGNDIRIYINLSTEKGPVIIVQYEYSGPCKYIFDPLKNVFILIGKEESLDITTGLTYVRPKQLSIDNFTEIVKDTLAIIPTTFREIED